LLKLEQSLLKVEPPLLKLEQSLLKVEPPLLKQEQPQPTPGRGSGQDAVTTPYSSSELELVWLPQRNLSPPRA
jgi:hypothetical protein